VAFRFDFGLKCTDRGRPNGPSNRNRTSCDFASIKRGIWIRVFPDKPISQKPAEMRMGNSKGNPDYYVAEIQ
jgi:large subunit ribosomal protein L16